MAKLHFSETEHGAIPEGICGWVAVPTTHDRDAFLALPDTQACKMCRTALAKRIAHEREGYRLTIDLAEAIRDAAYVIGGPPVLPYPDLTPDRFHSMLCRFGQQCRCEWCRLDEINKPILAQWEAEQQARPHRHYDHPFGSVRAALSSLTHDRHASSSSMGSALSRLRETHALGTFVQTTRRHDRDPIELRRVDQAVDVARAVAWAYREESARRGLPGAVCAAILLDAVQDEAPGAEEWAEDLGVTVSIVRGVISHGLRTVAAWLHLDGYMPEPRGGGVVDRVREAMGRQAV